MAPRKQNMILEGMKKRLDDRFWQISVSLDDMGPDAPRLRIVARVGRDGYYGHDVGWYDLERMLELDGRGWDSYGIYGLNAAIMQVAMRACGARPDRIPDARSGLRLTEHGESLLDMIARDFYRMSGLTPTPSPPDTRSRDSSPRTP